METVLNAGQVIPRMKHFIDSKEYKQKFTKATISKTDTTVSLSPVACFGAQFEMIARHSYAVH
jgi:hypothetical protein